MGVSQLGYVGINVSDMPLWRDILSSILGLEIGPETENSPIFVRMDHRHHRLALYDGDKDGIRYAGWQVDSPRDLEDMVDRLTRGGVTVTEGTAADAAERHVDALIRFKDPEGYDTEIFVSPARSTVPLKPGRAHDGFIAEDLGLGHIVYHCARYAECVDFYQEVLGFRISDYIRWADADATFMRCNPRHHSLALLNESLGFEGGSVNHLMIEAKSLDDVGRAYDMVQARGFPIIMTLGRHSNDHMTSFYFVSPSGFGIEYGWDGQLVDEETWTVQAYDTTKIWGHDMPGQNDSEQAEAAE